MLGLHCVSIQASSRQLLLWLKRDWWVYYFMCKFKFFFYHFCSCVLLCLCEKLNKKNTKISIVAKKTVEELVRRSSVCLKPLTMIHIPALCHLCLSLKRLWNKTVLLLMVWCWTWDSAQHLCVVHFLRQCWSAIVKYTKHINYRLSVQSLKHWTEPVTSHRPQSINTG